MTTEAGFDPLAILRVMDEHAVPLIVIGGFAVAAHKVVRATRDLDIVTDRAWPAAERLAVALRTLDAKPASDPSIPWIPDVLVRPINVRIATLFGDLHLLNATRGIPPYSDMDHMTILVDDLPIEVASLAALRAMKREAARPKDLVDLAELDAIHGSED
jgi:hypothetical protein